MLKMPWLVCQNDVFGWRGMSETYIEEDIKQKGNDCTLANHQLMSLESGPGIYPYLQDTLTVAFCWESFSGLQLEDAHGFPDAYPPTPRRCEGERA